MWIKFPKFPNFWNLCVLLNSSRNILVSGVLQNKTAWNTFLKCRLRFLKRVKIDSKSTCTQILTSWNSLRRISFFFQNLTFCKDFALFWDHQSLFDIHLIFLFFFTYFLVFIKFYWFIIKVHQRFLLICHKS